MIPPTGIFAFVDMVWLGDTTAFAYSLTSPNHDSVGRLWIVFLYGIDFYLHIPPIA